MTTDTDIHIELRKQAPKQLDLFDGRKINNGRSMIQGKRVRHKSRIFWVFSNYPYLFQLLDHLTPELSYEDWFKLYKELRLDIKCFS